MSFLTDKKAPDDKSRAQTLRTCWIRTSELLTLLAFAAGWKRNFSLLRGILYHTKYALSIPLRNFFKKLFGSAKPDFCRNLTTTFNFYAKYTKTPTTNRYKILSDILFAEKIDEKSYKMDIYKTPPVVYNKSPE